jgi:biliverdin reductase
VKPLGVALVGPGRAGRARVLALQASAQAELRAIVEHRDETRFEAVLADPAIDAVLVCTPNALHPDQVRRALEARRHVCVEYPLASGPEPATELFDLARRVGRVLHVEHIELLSPAQEHQRHRVRELGSPRGGSLEFSGGWTGWIADPALSGSPALLALARLNRLVDLFGPARIAAAELERSGSGYRLSADLEFERGGATRLIEARAPALPRGLRWNLPCERGELRDPPALPAQGLFKLDWLCFLERVTRGAASYVSEERITHGLQLVQQIEYVLRSSSDC